MAKPDTVQGGPREDPRRPRQARGDATACSATSKRTSDREAVKPYLFVHAKAGKWEVLHTPKLSTRAPERRRRLGARLPAIATRGLQWAMLDVLQSMADGLLFGATYSLIGIGFTLVFGVMHKINMAYAAASLAGAYAGVVLLQARGPAAVAGDPARLPRRRACSGSSIYYALLPVHSAVAIRSPR